jgi:tripartite-type tricarboxylate transporter receptor subunit TctC
MHRRTLIRRLAGLACASALAASAGAASAQSWPDRPLRFIVPSTPGGTLDLVARMLAESMQPMIGGQTIVVDNKAGAAGIIGVTELLKAPRDGHTVLIHISGGITEIPHVVKTPYDPFGDLRPLVELGRSGLVLVANPQFAPNSLREVVAHAKANPGKTSYASYSPGTISHTLGIELNRVAGIDLNHVPYKGSVPALQDVMSGQVPIMFDGPVTSLPQVQGGRVKALAVTSPQRMAALPSVPTVAEAGYPSLTQISGLLMIVTPDVPAAVQARLREMTLQVVQSPRYRERLATLGTDPGGPATPHEIARSLRADSDRHAALLKSVGFQQQ